LEFEIWNLKLFMLTHIVCWKYNTEATEEQRKNHISRLQNLKNEIDCVKSLNVGSDILHLDRSFDTGLVAIFADKAALDEYTVHSAHQEVVAIGRAISEKVVSVDFVD
jgi:Stress responsive A/B Barrel Domain